MPLSHQEGVAKGLWERTLGREEPGTVAEIRGLRGPRSAPTGARRPFCDTLTKGEGTE